MNIIPHTKWSVEINYDMKISQKNILISVEL